MCKKISAGGEATVKSDRAFLAAYQKGDWKTVYQKQIAYLEKVRQTAKENTIDATMKSVLNRDLLMYQALAKENFAYEDPYFPTQALPFVLSLTDYLFPALLPIALIFILSNLYTSAFASKTIDKTRLLPERAWRLALKDITVGFVVSLALIVLSVLPVFLVAAIFFGVGEWDYPVLHYRLSDKTLYFSAIKDSVLPSLLLQVLSLLVMSVAIYLIAQLVKNKVATLFVALVVLLGAVVLPLVVVPLAPYVQWLPTGYIKSFEVATGLLQHQLDNWQMSATQGYGVLIAWLLGLTLLSLLWKAFSARKVQFSLA